MIHIQHLIVITFQCSWLEFPFCLMIWILTENHFIDILGRQVLQLNTAEKDDILKYFFFMFTISNISQVLVYPLLCPAATAGEVVEVVEVIVDLEIIFCLGEPGLELVERIYLEAGGSWGENWFWTRPRTVSFLRSSLLPPLQQLEQELNNMFHDDSLRIYPPSATFIHLLTKENIWSKIRFWNPLHQLLLDSYWSVRGHLNESWALIGWFLELLPVSTLSSSTPLLSIIIVCFTTEYNYNNLWKLWAGLTLKSKIFLQLLSMKTGIFINMLQSVIQIRGWNMMDMSR